VLNTSTNYITPDEVGTSNNTAHKNVASLVFVENEPNKQTTWLKLVPKHQNINQQRRLFER
jgi:hypothetical protein